ncbi:MAG: C25 family cysteine peptidase [bacterium]
MWLFLLILTGNLTTTNPVPTKTTPQAKQSQGIVPQQNQTTAKDKDKKIQGNVGPVNGTTISKKTQEDVSNSPRTIEVLNSSKSGIDFIYNTGEIYETSPYILNADVQPEAGKPALPVTYVTIGIPIGAKVEIQFEELKGEETRNKEVPPLQDFTSKEKDKTLYAQDIFWPSKVVEIAERNIYRGQEIIKLRINPIRYNPVRKTMAINKSLKVHLKFSGGSGTYRQDKIFENTFKAVLLNYEQAKNWRLSSPLKSSRKYSTGSWYKIEVSAEGIYKIDRNQLNSVGIGRIDPTTIKIYNGGSKMVTNFGDSLIEIPISILPDTSILFYATVLAGYGKNESEYFNPFTNTNIYWLTYGESQGKRDSLESSGSGTAASYFGDTLHIEQDNECPAKCGLSWVWERIEREPGTHSIAKNYTFNATGVYSTSCNITVAVYGWYTDMSSGAKERSDTMRHRIKIYLNNTEIMDKKWIGPNEYPQKTFEGVASSLKEGQNTLKFEVVKDDSSTDKDILFFDWFEVRYSKSYRASNGELKFHGKDKFTITDFQESPIIFNISNPLHPVKVYGSSFANGTAEFYGTEGNYYASCRYKSISSIKTESPYNLRNKTAVVKNIIISPSDFMEYAIRLKDYRNNYGMATEVVALNDIYNNFSWGLSSSPYAIKNFLTYAYDNWGEPGYCLLLGAGTFAYKSDVPKNRIPAREEGYKVGEYGYPPQSNYCWDDWFTDRDFAIGRITAKSKEEASNAVDKLIKYETSQGVWQNRVLLISDDEYPDRDMFVANLERCANMLPKEYDAFKVYSMNYPLEGTVKPRAENDIIRNIDKGMYMTLASGHGNLYLFCHEVLFYNPRDIDALNNSVKNPIWQFWSCGVGCFDRIDDDCMADYLQKVYNKGAIASVASTRTTGGSSGMDTLLISLLLKQKLNTLGQGMYGRSLAKDLQVNENLFADPATRLPERVISVEIDSFSNVIRGGEKLIVKGKAPGAKFAFITVRSSEYTYTYNYNSISYAGITGSTKYKMRGRMLMGPDQKPFQLIDDILFEGVTEVKNGVWEQEFFIPELDSIQDTLICGDQAKISVFAWNGNLCGNTYKDISAKWGKGNIKDITGPKITMAANGKTIKLGEPDTFFTVPGQFTFSATLEDESGINIFNRITPLNLVLALKIKSGKLLDFNVQLADYFQYDVGSCTRGRVSYQLDLTEKIDTLVFQASDNLGNTSVTTAILRIEPASELTLTKVMNFPNPVRGEHTEFHFFLSKQSSVTIKIYTVSGRFIKTIESAALLPGSNKIYWDTRDKLGNRVANGIYMYKINAVSEGSTREEISKVYKLMILR